MTDFDVSLNVNGKLTDFLDGGELEPTPEEFIRQWYLRVLHYEYQYPKNVLAREVPIQYGSGHLLDRQGNPVRADIVVYRSATARKDRDQGNMALVVECKAPDETAGHNQLVSYIYNTSAEGGVLCNGGTIRYYRRLFSPTSDLIDWVGIPRRDEAWDALGRRKKADLKRPKDIKGLLRQCHNKLHGRGVDGDEEDLTMDMVRLILAKAMDEEKSAPDCEFYCTPEEYGSESGRGAVATRIEALFAEVVEQNRDVFQRQERITVGPRAICDVVIELQRYRLLSDLNASDDWDIMGHAYEQYTSTYLKRKKGQFFTNRLVVDFLCEAVEPVYTDLILDPAGGSGGFLTGSMRFVRKQILQSSATQVAKQRQLDKHRTNLFMVEISSRLVKIAKTAMILNGDGHTGMTQGDSLGPIENLNDRVLARCGLGKPTVILTNPPFAGIGDGRITDPQVLDTFQTGIRWSTRGGAYQPTGERNTEGVPPEMLFFERCLQWVAPGGRVGIVMPKSFLDTQTYYPGRKLLLDKHRLLAVVNCHKNTFQPHTGTRTCLLIVERPEVSVAVPTSYPIFMAISKRIGQDSEGIPIFVLDAQNESTEAIDHDLSEILEDYKAHQRGRLVESEYRFAIDRSQIDEQLRLNPQFYLPDLNETIKQVESINNLAGWSVTTLGQLEAQVKIFKGPRLKTENLLVEEPGEHVEPYYTPTAVFQEKAEAIKYLDLSRASAKQLAAIEQVRIRRGDIVVTRSGSIGRVALITQRLDGAIVSDDLIRVRIPDEDLRLYAYKYLLSREALNQMLKNEYGAIQQHLEPTHLSNLLLPIPDDATALAPLIAEMREELRLRERQEALSAVIAEKIDFLLASLIRDALVAPE